MRQEGKDVALIGYGHSVLECLAAAEILKNVSTTRNLYFVTLILFRLYECSLIF